MDHSMDRATETARRASSFGSQAAAYAEYRPNYPADLLAWALEPASAASADGLRVLDLGAGTGKLTEGLLAFDVEVVAVEPDTSMLAELTRRFPGVEARSGTAEVIPLPDASVHAVFAGQALHWFDLDRALPEIGRVLLPGGFLVAAWNVYDDSVPWVAEFCRITEGIAYSESNMSWENLEPLGPTEQATFLHSTRRTVDSLVNTVATQSNMLVSTPKQRAAALARTREFLLANPASADGEFDIPMISVGIRATPR
ncbi:MAG TPA: class I SAM-dependent methyltransferase [Pseudonocardiaceae bacterium]|nr:class I SAM-dependent methyltransferase [Pseudonocardiaceae bacterium]